MRIYVASSWRNYRQPAVVQRLREDGHEVYGVRASEFAWSEIDPAWRNWNARQFVAALQHPVAAQGFDNDMAALCAAEATVLLMPCGRSAHLELGYAVGRGQRTAVLLEEHGSDPELMYRMAGLVTDSLEALIAWLGDSEQQRAPLTPEAKAEVAARLGDALEEWRP